MFNSNNLGQKQPKQVVTILDLFEQEDKFSVINQLNNGLSGGQLITWKSASSTPVELIPWRQLIHPDVTLKDGRRRRRSSLSLCKFYLKVPRTRVCGRKSHDRGEAFRLQQTGSDIRLHQLTIAPFLVCGGFERHLLRGRWSWQHAAQVLLTSAAGLLGNNNPAALIGGGVMGSRRFEAVQWSSKLKESERRSSYYSAAAGKRLLHWTQQEQAAVAQDKNWAGPIELLYSLARRTEECGYFLKTLMYAHLNIALLKQYIAVITKGEFNSTNLPVGWRD